MTFIDQITSQQEMQSRITAFIFDMLNTAVAPELAERFRYPKCPMCGRRPELVQKSHFFVQVRSNSDIVVKVPRYDVLPCCSMKYTLQHEGPSQGVIKKQAYQKRVKERR